MIKEWEELNAKALGQPTAETFDANIELGYFLRNHSEALLELVKAAKEVVEWSELDTEGVRLRAALAKLGGK